MNNGLTVLSSESYPPIQPSAIRFPACVFQCGVRTIVFNKCLDNITKILGLFFFFFISEKSQVHLLLEVTQSA